MAAIAANILVNRNERCVPMSVKPLRFLLAAGAIALIPAAAATQAASEADTHQQLDQPMTVLETVRSESVYNVDYHLRTPGAITDQLASPEHPYTSLHYTEPHTPTIQPDGA